MVYTYGVHIGVLNTGMFAQVRTEEPSTNRAVDVTLLTSQPDISWLKDKFVLNIWLISVTDIVFHKLSG